MKTAVIYARIRGVKNPHQQIKDQIALCRHYANEKGIDIVGTYTDIEELGEPTGQRAALAKMVDDSRTATWDIVITYAADRICRKRQQFEKFERTLEKRGKSLLIVTSPDHQFYREMLHELNKLMKQIRKKENERK